jgi:hypothetical protein
MTDKNGKFTSDLPKQIQGFRVVEGNISHIAIALEYRMVS